jgi:flotillin
MSLDIQAMTQEKLSLTLPIMCTVGPEDDIPQLKKYCMLLTGNEESDHEHVENVIKGVIEGEIRYGLFPIKLRLVS